MPLLWVQFFFVHVLQSISDFDYFSLIPPLYTDLNRTDNSYKINIYKIEEELSVDLWIESLKVNKQVLIVFHYPPDTDIQTYCIDGIERPVSSYELEDGESVKYTEETMSFLISISDKIEITPGITTGYDGKPDFFKPNSLHPDILRAFSAMTEDFFNS